MITHGMKVTLNERGIRYHTPSAGVHKRHRPHEWRGRIGVVSRISYCKKYIAVIWQGNKSLSNNIPIIFFDLA